MLKVVTGRFHPHLESALVDQIARSKDVDRLAPIAILVPSKSLAERLRTLLAVEHHLSFLNLHVLTFHQLALRLASEPTPGSRLPRVVDELFFEQLVRQIVHTQFSSFTPLQRIGHSAGTWSALWSTIRDLKDAGVDPAQALQGLHEGYFEADERNWLGALFPLYAAVKEVGKTLQVGTEDDLAEALTPFVPTAPFIQSLRKVFYYGFYDLTQVQLSFFEAISRTTDTTLYFPLEGDSSSEFARKFFGRNIQPLVAAEDRVIRLGESTPSPIKNPIQLTARSMIGVEEELAATCRAILDLVETNGHRFNEIGVTARTLDPYSQYLRPVFDRHRIPLRTTAERPLIREPVCKLLLQLANLPLNDFYRATVLDIVTSPLYVSDLYDDLSASYRPDQWKLLVQALRITHGVDEWRRLEQASRSALTLDGEDDTAGPMAVRPDVISLLWDVVSQLRQDCMALPVRGMIGQMVAAFRELVDRRMRRIDADETATQGAPRSRTAMTWEAIERNWVTLMELEPIREEMTWTEFVELLTHVCERTMIPLDEVSHLGVTVFDVMATRGLPFKALFILGLNEKVFPRYIREDPFLRDRHRRVLDATLGFKIDEKLAAYEEEALLFNLLCQAAGPRLYLSYQRADEAGRVLAASPYLREAHWRFSHTEQRVEALPRRLPDRLWQRPTTKMFLPPGELAQWLAMNGQDPTDLLVALGVDAETFRHAAAALDRVEDDSTTLNPFDGITGTIEAQWARILERGMAPTPLERYARCPFQYFSADILRLEPNRVSVGYEPDATLLGTLCHFALRRCYEQLVGFGWPTVPVSDSTITRCISLAVEQAAAALEGTHRTGHLLLWELAKEQIVTLVSAAVRADEAAQIEEPYTPIAFEVDGEGTVPGVLNQGSLKVLGRIDRLDRHRNSGALRVIDYKFKVGSAMKQEDRNLVQSAIRGYRLQPLLYSCLTIQGQRKAGQVLFMFLAPQWSIPISRATFEAVSWSSNAGKLTQKTLTTLLEGIENGRYFILPDGYCESCEFRVACRREHAPTWWRSYRAAEPKALKMLRMQRIADE